MNAQHGWNPLNIEFLTAYTLLIHPVHDCIYLDTIILGAPITTNIDEWEAIRKIVSGRLINGWTESDWVLGLLCHDNVAGTQRINWRQIEDKRLVNVRLTGTISGHTDYQAKMSKILRLIDACQEEYKINRYYNGKNQVSVTFSLETMSIGNITIDTKQKSTFKI